MFRSQVEYDPYECKMLGFRYNVGQRICKILRFRETQIDNRQFTAYLPATALYLIVVQCPRLSFTIVYSLHSTIAHQFIPLTKISSSVQELILQLQILDVCGNCKTNIVYYC